MKTGRPTPEQAEQLLVAVEEAAASHPDHARVLRLLGAGVARNADPDGPGLPGSEIHGLSFPAWFVDDILRNPPPPDGWLEMVERLQT